MPEIMTIKVLAEVEYEISGALGSSDAVSQVLKHLQAGNGDRVPGGGKVIGVRTDGGIRRWNRA